MKKIFLLFVCFFLLIATPTYAQETYEGKTAEQWLDEANFEIARGRYNPAIEACSNSIILRPTAQAYFLKGLCYSHLGVYNQAETELTDAININPNNPTYYLWRGNALARRYIYDEAISDFTKAIQLEPNNAVAYLRRGICYQNQNENEKAIADFDKSLSLDPNNRIAYYYKGVSSEQLGLKNQAIDCFNLFLQNSSNAQKEYINDATERLERLKN